MLGGNNSVQRIIPHAFHKLNLASCPSHLVTSIDWNGLSQIKVFACRSTVGREYGPTSCRIHLSIRYHTSSHLVQLEQTRKTYITYTIMWSVVFWKRISKVQWPFPRIPARRFSRRFAKSWLCWLPSTPTSAATKISTVMAYILFPIQICRECKNNDRMLVTLNFSCAAMRQSLLDLSGRRTGNIRFIRKLFYVLYSF